MLFPVVLMASLALVQQAPAVPAPARPAPVVQAENATPAPANTLSNAAETDQVCRTEAVTGSRFGRRVCRSRIQTDEERAASREMLRQMQGARVPPTG